VKEKKEWRKMNDNLINDEALDEALDRLGSYGVVDDDLDLMIPASSNRWASWLDVLEWKSTDGPVEGVWKARSPGQRCLWLCKWATSSGEIGPDQLLPLHQASDGQLLAELEDRAELNKWGGISVRRLHLQPQFIEFIAKMQEGAVDENLRYRVRQFLSENRDGYHIAYFAAWDPPTNPKYKYYRSGWPTEADFTAEEEPQPTEQESPAESKRETINF
jgi:hypothetical protein